MWKLSAKSYFVDVSSVWWRVYCEWLCRHRQLAALLAIYTAHPKNDECFCLMYTITGEYSWPGNIWITSNCQWCSVAHTSCRMSYNRWSTVFLSSSIRTLFATFIFTYFSSNWRELRKKYKDDMPEEILNRVRFNFENPLLEINE